MRTGLESSKGLVATLPAPLLLRSEVDSSSSSVEPAVQTRRSRDASSFERNAPDDRGNRRTSEVIRAERTRLEAITHVPSSAQLPALGSREALRRGQLR